MTPRRLRALWVTALVVSPVALGGAEIRIVDGNRSGEGLDDRTPVDPVGGNPGTTLGEQRLIAAQYAAALWSATLGNQVPIAIRTEFTDLDCSGGTAVLGAAGPTLLYDSNRYPAALANERSGRDLDPGREEIDARFNARVGRSDCAVTAWYTGFDNQGPTGTTDLASVFLHEMAHGLGFIKSATAFRDQAQDDTSGVLLSQLSAADYEAAIRRPLGVSWVGPAVRATKDALLDKTDGLMRLLDGRTFPLARARFGPGHVSVTAPVVLAQNADGGTSHDACGPLAPSPGALVLAERGLRADAGLFCFVAQRALNAQAAGAVGLLVRPIQSGTGPTSYTGDAGTELTIPVWGISSDDGATLEAYTSAGGGPVAVDADGRRAGENLAGDVLLYTPSTYSDGSSVGHWDSSASPPLLMMPIINPGLTRALDLTPAALKDVGWTPPTGLSIGATTLGRDLDDGRPPRFIVQIVNRGAAVATGVVLDERADPALRLVSTELSCAGGLSCTTGPLDCAGGLPCALGELAPGTVRTVITRYAFAGSAPRQASVEFRIAGSPAPAARNASTTAVATRASGCSTSGTGPGGTLALLVVAAWACRRRTAHS